jgi:pyruvate kinase
MVTLPAIAASDPDLLGSMVDSGLDIARINCAHDDPDTWLAMIGHVRSHRRRDGSAPRVAMDLGGPKVRTGPLRPGPPALRIAPRRDRLGTVVEPAFAWLSADEPDAAGVSWVPIVDPQWAADRRQGDRIELVDSRGATRSWEVIDCSDDGCLVVSVQTTYVTDGLQLLCGRTGEVTAVGALPPTDVAHRVGQGDRIVLTRSDEPAAPTPMGFDHAIGCTLPEAFDAVHVGDRVWLDDGKIGGVVDRVTADAIEIITTDVKPGGANLRAGKGINFPNADIDIDALTDQDLVDLDVVAAHADIVNLSFVRRPEDIEMLLQAVEARGADRLAIVLKIENVAAFERLPDLLLMALRRETVGVMIARGDLAVEVGFERLAEVQEEILWACEAAHVPVIWATQVLDTLARTGRATRAEITDAAMSDRAECVMLNKGPHIVEAIRSLDSILTRMQEHQSKKRSLLRRLRAWDRTPG